jgi:ABC-type lipoprotein release transport system permease subunit
MIAAGIATGLIGAYIAGRLIERSLAGVESTQPLTFTVMMGVLAAAALAACLIPARRAARIDPTRALRTD